MACLITTDSVFSVSQQWRRTETPEDKVHLTEADTSADSHSGNNWAKLRVSATDAVDGSDVTAHDDVRWTTSGDPVLNNNNTTVPGAIVKDIISGRAGAVDNNYKFTPVSRGLPTVSPSLAVTNETRHHETLEFDNVGDSTPSQLFKNGDRELLTPLRGDEAKVNVTNNTVTNYHPTLESRHHPKEVATSGGSSAGHADPVVAPLDGGSVLDSSMADSVSLVSDTDTLDSSHTFLDQPSDCEQTLPAGSLPGSQSRRLRTRNNRKPVADRVRQKRQTLQDMTRPLKQWLYTNRDNPYPSKADKSVLAISSRMTLTQVSNWFANARRRLKNTVRDPNMGWSRRIKLYNSCVEGNAELLSISSGDSDMEVEKELPGTSTGNVELQSEGGGSLNPQLHQEEINPPSGATHHDPVYWLKAGDVTAQDGDVSTRNSLTSPRVKNCSLNRYLDDCYQHSIDTSEPFKPRDTTCRNRHSSGSLSSHDFETISTSSCSSSTAEHSHIDDPLCDLEKMAAKQWQNVEEKEDDDMYWKEISAALALTNLARAGQKRKSTSPT